MTEEKAKKEEEKWGKNREEREGMVMEVGVAGIMGDSVKLHPETKNHPFEDGRS